MGNQSKQPNYGVWSYVCLREADGKMISMA